MKGLRSSSVLVGHGAKTLLLQESLETPRLALTDPLATRHPKEDNLARDHTKVANRLDILTTLEVGGLNQKGLSLCFHQTVNGCSFHEGLHRTDFAIKHA